jgi:transcription-repair coupling factor (superfamily II helicase)
MSDFLNNIPKVYGIENGNIPYWAFKEWQKSKGSLLVMLPDHGSMQKCVEELKFLLPKAHVMPFPAWDVQPYDRLNPDAIIQAQRMAVLSALKEDGRHLVVTTPAALMVKVPPLEHVAGAVKLSVGDTVDRDKFLTSLAEFGYLRVGTVMEPGEFSVRGALIDVFPPTEERPFRLDFFDDELDGIKAFEPSSQRSEESVDSVRVSPASEVPMSEESIKNFREGYRGLFPEGAQDEVYESLSNGRRHGMASHYLNLFYNNGLNSFINLLDDTFKVLSASGVEEHISGKWATAEDAFKSRVELMAVYKKKVSEDPYRPVAPEDMYVDPESFFGALKSANTEMLMQLNDGDVKALPFKSISLVRDAKSLNKSAADIAVDTLTNALSEGWQVLLSAFLPSSLIQLTRALEQHGFSGASSFESFEEWQKGNKKSSALVSPLSWGVVDKKKKLLILTEQDVFGEKVNRVATGKKKQNEDAFTHFSELSIGDYVVHQEHGIGKFTGMQILKIDGAEQDFLLLEYGGGDKLYVPIFSLGLLSRFAHSEADGTRLDKLGGAAWQARKAKVKEDLLAMAGELIKIAAQREVRLGHKYTRHEGLYDEFSIGFPYTPTDEQQNAINDVEGDMIGPRAMDRVVVGDVGFGKTEVAMRAAFLAASDGKQVAVVVPTTLLARQHYQNFKSRFAQFPINVAMVSRLVQPKLRKKALDGLEKGQVDVVIGTHALLGKTVKFKDIGLVVVDEEHHFGVRHKERLKQMKDNVDVLTLTATPIPRTMQMALGGLRDLSLITSPPVDRLAVRTYVMKMDSKVIREAILREIHRDGQVFVVTPYVDDIPKLSERINALVPEASIRIAHGQMSRDEMEDVMVDFYEGKFNVLISTTIVESGIDVPNANTLIVNRADRFGLAQLHQLRGRVGRGNSRAYCYLLLPERGAVSDNAEKRLKIMQKLDKLGAGFTLASYDLDIRGAGNLLGTQQSGHIREVGFELYNQMLGEAIADAQSVKGEKPSTEPIWEPSLELGLSFLIPEAYVKDFHARLGLYRRLSKLKTEDDIQNMQDELLDRFGELPEEVTALFDVVRMKNRLQLLNIDRLQVGDKGAVIKFHKQTFRKAEQLLHHVLQNAGVMTVKPDQSLVVHRPFPKGGQRLRVIDNILSKLESL